MTIDKPTIPQEKYTSDYYLKASDGAELFRITNGSVLPKRLQAAIDFAAISTGMNILDVGCGRGEILLHCLKLGAFAWGIDYASAAVRIARTTVDATLAPDLRTGVSVIQSDARTMPFTNDSMDRVFMLDIVEHLTPDELKITFLEINRVLKPNGALIIHTMPNTWYYNYGYPLYRFVHHIRGIELPTNPRDRWDYSEVHINEQNIRSLRQALQAANYQAHVWLKNGET
jgi:cyclopropane fatty-acyl-phospholipid synthase-like methyltransferase